MRCAWNTDPKDPFNSEGLCQEEATILYHGWSLCDAHLESRLSVDREELRKIKERQAAHIAASSLEIDDILRGFNR